jgi:predicted nucleic-acid-binding Zn-ribbon protein
MRSSGTCPKCSHREIWIIDQAAVARSVRMDDSQLPPQIAARIPPGKHMYKQETVDRFEAAVCGACGYTEWFATDLDAVRAVGRRVGAPAPYR